MSSHYGMIKDLSSDPVHFPSDDETIVQRKSGHMVGYAGTKCDFEFPFTYRSKEIYGCIKKGRDDETEIVGPANDCCSQVELTSKNDIDSVMWNQMPELKGKTVTGRYIKINKTENTYYSHESGSLYLCINGYRQWQVYILKSIISFQG